MRFDWTDEQQQLMDMLRRFVTDRHDFDRRRERLRTGDGQSIWSELAELGVMAVPFPEKSGGIGGTMLDVAIVAEALGRGIVIEPYVPTVLLAGGILRRSARPDEFGHQLEAIAAGKTRMALAQSEGSGRYNTAWCECTATRMGDNWRLDGQKSMVFGGDEADTFIIVARTNGSPGDKAGLALFSVDSNAQGLLRRNVRNVDGSGAAELEFEGVSIPSSARLDDGANAFELVSAVVNDAAVAACAEMCGAIASLNARTLAYLQQRKAFGQEIAKFQVVQHRLVDMWVSQEQCVAITLKAAQALAEEHEGAAHRVAAAKHLVSEEAAEVAKHAVQLHGAIGVTDELDISHYFRRIAVLAGAFGDADYHLARFSERKITHEAA